jgi:hypothetical protein
MLAEKITVVAQEHDAGVVKFASRFQRVEEGADAFVDCGHHLGTQPDLSLGPGMDGLENLSRDFLLTQFEALGPGRL